MDGDVGGASRCGRPADTIQFILFDAHLVHNDVATLCERWNHDDGVA